MSNGDGDVETMQGENQQTQGSDGGGGEGGTQQHGPSFTLTYLRAIYIWGPGDSPTSGVDELLVQIDPRDTGPGTVADVGGKPWYAVNDAQGDLVALLHKKPSSWH